MVRPPFGALRFLYVGSSDVGRDLEYYTGVLGAEKIWDLSSFGTRVAAVRICDGPRFFWRGIVPRHRAYRYSRSRTLMLLPRSWRGRGGSLRAASSRFRTGPATCSRIQVGTSLQYSKTSGLGCSSRLMLERSRRGLAICSDKPCTRISSNKTALRLRLIRHG